MLRKLISILTLFVLLFSVPVFAGSSGTDQTAQAFSAAGAPIGETDDCSRTYGEIIQNYIMASRDHWSAQQLRDNHMSPIVALNGYSVEQMCYCLPEINDEPTNPELVICAQHNSGPIILAVYTVVDSKLYDLMYMNSQDTLFHLAQNGRIVEQLPDALIINKPLYLIFDHMEKAVCLKSESGQTAYYYTEDKNAFSNAYQNNDLSRVERISEQRYQEILNEYPFETSGYAPLEIVTTQNFRLQILSEENNQPLTGATVSDGINTVTTGPDGMADLAVKDADAITVSCHGYYPETINISDLNPSETNVVYLEYNEHENDSFNNTIWSFGNSRDWFPLTQEQLDSFASKFNDDEMYNIDLLKDSTKGHCFGFAVSSALVKTGQIDPSGIVPSGILYDAQYNPGNQSIVNFYFVTEGLNSYLKQRADYFNAHSNGQDYRKILSEIAQIGPSISNDNPYLIDIYDPEEGHTVLATGFQSGNFESPNYEASYPYKLVIYDSNAYSDNGLITHNNQYDLYFDPAQGRWEIPAYVHSIPGLSGSNYMTQLYYYSGKQANFFVYPEPEGFSQRINFTMSNFVLNDLTDGRSWIFNSKNPESFKDCPYLVLPYTDSGENGDSRIMITLPSDNHNYEIKVTDAGKELSYSDEDETCNVIGSGVDSIKITGGKVSVSNKTAGDSRIEMVSNLAGKDKFCTYILEGSNLGDVSITPTASGITVSGNNLSGKKLSGKNYTGGFDSMTVGSGNTELNLSSSGSKLSVNGQVNTAASLEPHVQYRSHVENQGWGEFKQDGQTVGTSGQALRQEAIEVKVTDNNGNPVDGLGISYRSHVQDLGWENWVENGQISGTTGQAKKVEAVQLKLTGNNADKYNLCYRTHCEDFGWTDWASNGKACGTEGYNKRMEAIEIRIIPKDSSEVLYQGGVLLHSGNGNGNIHYQSQIENIGWTEFKQDGEVSGTTGQNLKLETLRILKNPDLPDGDIVAQGHVQDYGWMDPVSNYDYCGTVGQNKRLEGLKLTLTGELAEKYDIYYKAHVQDEGWQNWKKNGEVAGTTGKSRKIEAVQIRLIEKGSPAPVR